MFRSSKTFCALRNHLADVMTGFTSLSATSLSYSGVIYEVDFFKMLSKWASVREEYFFQTIAFKKKRILFPKVVTSRTVSPSGRHVARGPYVVLAWCNVFRDIDMIVDTDQWCIPHTQRFGRLILYWSL